MNLTDKPTFQWANFLEEEAGTSLMEFALVAMLVAVAASLALLALNKWI